MDKSKWLISVCGLNCGACDIFQSGKGDKDKLESIVNFFRNEQGLNIEPNQVKCEGCRGSLDNHWSPTCPMMLCSKLKIVDYCFQCSEFVCDKLESFANDGHGHHKRTVENMKMMKKIGVETWVLQQKKKGSQVLCP